MTRAGQGGIGTRTPFEVVCDFVELLLQRVMDTVTDVTYYFTQNIGTLIEDALIDLGFISLSPLIPDFIENMSLFEFTLGGGISIFLAIVVIHKFVGIFK